MNVKWYNGTTLLEDETYTLDEALYFCNTPVQAYNKIVITINNMTKADRFLKIFNIADGITRQFFNEELQNLEIIEQVENNNEALSINEASMNILPLSNEGVLFQRTLPFSIYRNDVLYGRFFISTSSSNTDKTLYNVKVADYINILDGQTYLGGLYSGTTASSLIADILGDIPYTLDGTLGAKTISGYLPILSKREALREVAFCINALIDTSRSDEIIIEEYPTTSSRTIGESEIVTIQTTQPNITTDIELTTTSLTTTNAEMDDIFSGVVSGTQTIIFDSPKFSLTISGGTILTSNINYAIIQGTGGTVTLQGKSYELVETLETKSNSYVVSTDITKIESYETTLKCDGENIINNLDFIKYKIKSNFLMSTTKVGDIVTLNGQEARILKLNYDISQTNIYSDAELEAYYGWFNLW